MRRGRVIALVAVGSFAAAAVAAGVVLARRENREMLAEQTAAVSKRAQKLGNEAIKSARKQYEAAAPKAREAVSSILAQAPQAVETIATRLPKIGVSA